MNAPRIATVGPLREFNEFVQHLENRQGIIVLVSGPPGSGRTLVGAAESAARELGYRSVGTPEPWRFDQDTTMLDIKRTLEALLEEGSGVERPPASNSNGLLTRLVDRVRKSTKKERDQVLCLLDRAAPLVAVVDGYAPSAPLSEWVTNALVPHVHQSSEPIIFVVCDTRDALRPLANLADYHLGFGPLNIQELNKYLGELTVHLDPPVRKSEFDAYRDAAALDADLIEAFTVVFRYLPRAGEEHDR